MKNKRIIAIILCVVCSLTFVGYITPEADTALISYTSKLLGHPEEEVYALYTQCGTLSAFLDEVDVILDDIIIAEQWDNSDKTVENLDEIAAELGIEETLMQRHIDICGEEYFVKRVCPNDISALSSGDEATDDPIDSKLFKQFYEAAHTGNIFLTKDSANLSYRHGHCGIVSSEWYVEPEERTIVEALGDNEDPEKEIVERKIKGDYWGSRTTLAIYYPEGDADEGEDVITAREREEAGRYASELAKSKQCRYKTFIKKGDMEELFPKVNCISLVSWCYLQVADYDLTPQTRDSSYMYPSHIQFSPIIRIKTMPGGMYRTNNWNDYDWGWN